MTAPRSALAAACLLLSPALASAAPDPDPRIAKMLAEVSPARLEATLAKLESFQTRHTLSSPDTPGRGIGAARQWILEEMKGYSPRLQVSFDAYRIPKQGERITREAELRNVMAVLPGKTPRRFYVSGHYDSVARPVPSPKPGAPAAGQSASGGFDWTVTDNLAPGVNDDGSGTALTMELARVFAQSGLDFDATLVFICFAGEEEGLVGAKLHAQRAAAEKELAAWHSKARGARGKVEVHVCRVADVSKPRGFDACQVLLRRWEAIKVYPRAAGEEDDGS
jgi:acetylornithine deacetylase/succinyl-diaminopimelate desuccinylase-like protein